MTITDAVDTYVQVWNEPDPATRGQLVRRLWAENAVEYTDANEYRGHDQLDARVAKAHIQFVEEGGFVFRLSAPPAVHHGSVLLAVDMVPVAGGPAAWTGTIIAFLGEDGRIEREYQFGRNLVPA